MTKGLRNALRDLAWPAALFAATGGALLLTNPFGALGRAEPARAAPATQCRAGEQVIYSCRFGPVARATVGSICGSGSAVHYRFGPAGRPRLELSSRPDWSNIHTGRVRGQGAGGYQEHVRFTAGETDTIVFRGQDGELASRPGRTYSGIEVQSPQGGRTLACRAGARIAPSLVEAVSALAPPDTALDEIAEGPFDAWF